jgi:hypothetical protein
MSSSYYTHQMSHSITPFVLLVSVRFHEIINLSYTYLHHPVTSHQNAGSSEKIALHLTAQQVVKCGKAKHFLSYLVDLLEARLLVNLIRSID